MFGFDIRLDHITVAGQNLTQMRDALACVQIPTEYGGPHANGATEMALTSFPDGSYLELIAIQPGASAEAVNAHSWCKFLKNDIGPCAFAAQVPDLAAEICRLKRAGIDASGPQRSGRTRPDGVRLEFEIADVAMRPWGAFFPFLIHDITPRENRARINGHCTTELYRGVSKVVIGVHELDVAIADYQRAYRLPAPRLQKDSSFEATLAWFEGSPIVLAQGLPGSWLTQRVRQFGDAPCAFVLALNNGKVESKPGNSTWFGNCIAWKPVEQLRWRLGEESISAISACA